MISSRNGPESPQNLTVLLRMIQSRSRQPNTAHVLTCNLKQTIFLCVWQAVHLNVAPPGEPQYKQFLRRVGWSVLAIIAPELVALNAWLQYRRADELMRDVNLGRKLTQVSPGTFYQRLWDCVGTYAGKAVFASLSVPDSLRMLFRHREEMLATQRERQQMDIIHLHTQLDSDTLPWTIDVAFYAISGAVILEDDRERNLTMGDFNISGLAEHDAAALIPIQRAALQNPGKASDLAKTITCTQALWFCSQCIARLSQNMAISLIELNTFAHCISAFFIYAFWWHKPYNAEAYTYVHYPKLLQEYLLSNIQSGTWRGVDVGEIGLGVDEYVIFERNSDGQGSTATIALDMARYVASDLDDTISYEVQYGATIPGTGFTPLCSNEADGHCPGLRLKYDTLEYWGRLWRLRTNTKLNPQFHHFRLTDPRKVIDRRAENFDREFGGSAFGDFGKTVTLILTSTFLVYGGVHLLAWQYNFHTDAEGTMWKIASIITASSGLFIPLAQTMSFLNRFRPFSLLGRLTNSLVIMGLILFLAFLICLEILARSFLVIESFKSLPNSPSSVYEIPRWTAYLPHI
jgi:hypothetical protein